MKPISRIGDKNIVGGAIMTGASNVFAEGKPVGTHVSPITPHKPFTSKHKVSKTTTGSPTVFAEGKPVLRVGTSTSCGHPIVEGAISVIVP
jgi:uncharacterized Zn-binding protein involved in type VI secretion